MKTQTIAIPPREGVTLTTYLLDTSPEMPNLYSHPAVLILPGGSYINCSDREAEPVAMKFLAQGYNAFILRYSLKEKAAFPNPLNDAESALEMIRKNADEWHVDRGKIAAIGFSAGGHLAAALGVEGRVRPNALILCYPCILSEMSDLLPVPIESMDEKVDEKTPPTFIMAINNDKLVPLKNPMRFAVALEEHNIPMEFHVFLNGDHGCSVANDVVCPNESYLINNKEASGWVEMCFDWLKLIF